MDLNNCNKIIKEFSQLIEEKRYNPFEGELKVGVDLGTANIVLAIVDSNNRPIAGELYPSSVVRDGIVVDYIGATTIVRELKLRLEERLSTEFRYAATAIPPGIIEGNAKIMTNVVESADMEVINVVDEPTAASSILNITDGAIVDIGGGTTGISIIKNSKVVFTGDEPTGGNHMTLVLAGSNKISVEEAEIYKKDKAREQEVFSIIRPVVEKMASIVKEHLRNYDINEVYLVGGSTSFTDFEKVFEKELDVKVVKPCKPLLVTPLGVAMKCVFNR
ncbi:ethanolamine utilization protein EutJ [Tissierella sp. MSJ-40]|uniref:Ethanolamine utilization protein EutJ n=1 Tax=Tissierella simiarum TaxID=2841534 RepID=A0ABS6E3Q2_9FIRM|nr:ethanolamine utilization protein EutJ [Tissierella simiarum]MBU5437537.1 ethanolamine utilization protein EutJ [Tissierella simiarum]